jgi:holliday junction DNA helicase RuvB
MIPNLRLVPDLTTASAMPDQALRPISFDDYVGQPEVTATLRRAITAARHGGRQLGHLLFAGNAGCGKTTAAQVVAAEIGAPLVATTGPAIEHRGALAAILTSLASGGVLFIDEIHGLDRKLQEILYSAMEDGVVDLQAGKKMIRMRLEPFTLVAATTRTALLTAPLRDRFAYTLQLRPYDTSAISEIVHRAASPIGVSIDPAAADEIASRSRGTPRVALRLLRTCRDFAAAATRSAVVTAEVARLALHAIGVDSAGLDLLDRAYLGAVAAAGAPIGVDAICAEIGEERRTIEEVVEPHLITLGFVRRTKAGRVVTAAGVAHLTPRPPRWAPENRMIGEDITDAEIVS